MNRLLEIKELTKQFFSRDWTLGEKILLIIDCILCGVVIGMILSPKGDRESTVGSFNSASQYEAIPDEE